MPPPRHTGARALPADVVLRLEVRHKDGGTVPLEIHSVGQVDGQGRFAGVHGSARDISE